MQTIGLFSHPDTDLHRAPGTHPERPERSAAVLLGLEAAGLLEKLTRSRPEEATLGQLERAHDPKYLQGLERACAQGPLFLDPDTYASPPSWRAARLAAGAAVEAVDRVLAGELDGAFCALRPPGHHAPAGTAMGFCLLNQVAIAARHAVLEHGLERVFILDWDVHHGNGTQAIFEQDPKVYYASLHQAPLYPGTGRAEERGSGPGLGTLLNCPLPAGSGSLEWRAALEQQVLPELRRFEPQLLLISAGFDAHRRDPLAQCELESEDFGWFTQRVLEALRGSAKGRVVSVLEGGYDERALAESAAAHVQALLEG